MSFSTVMSWLRPTFVVIGLLLVLLGVITMVKAHRRRRTWRPATGEVVASRLDGDGHIRYQVAFRLEGREVRFWNRFTSSAGVDPIGRTVDVLINPDDPADAVVVRGAPGSSAIGPIFVVVGVAAALVGLFALS